MAWKQSVRFLVKARTFFRYGIEIGCTVHQNYGIKIGCTIHQNYGIKIGCTVYQNYVIEIGCTVHQNYGTLRAMRFPLW
jgi:glycyl-tRNA synthetase alpha subunit